MKGAASIWCGVAWLAAACSPTTPEADPEAVYLADSTRAMAQTLARIAAESGTSGVSAFDEGGVAVFRARLEGLAAMDPRVVEVLVANYRKLLRGETEAAAEGWRSLRAELEGGDGVEPKLAALLHELLAVASLRLGEEENCVAHQGGVESCLFPIGPGGVHARPRGSRAAVVELEAWLSLEPEHLGARWLLNLAHMTLGAFPEGVPEPWRWDPASFASEVSMPSLRDVAAGTDLAVAGLAGGAALDDFDGDGLLDVVCSSSGPRDPLRFLKNLGDGRFADRSRAVGFSGETGGINLCHADVDNDGDQDLLVLRGGWLYTSGLYPNSLLRNNGDGTFDDATVELGLDSAHPTHGAAFADYDLDGVLDLFVGNESSPLHRAPSELYRGTLRGRYREVAREEGLEVEAFVKGVAWGDIEGDGDPDLYVSTLRSPNQLWRNRPQASPRFRDVTERAGVGEPIDAFATWFWDANHDGALDLFVAGFSLAPGNDVAAAAAVHLGLPTDAARPRYYENRGDGTFADRTSAVGLDGVILAMGANFGDVDGDGWLDAYVGTGEPKFETLIPNRLFRNEGGERFRDATTAAGVGHLQKGHGIAFGDVDQDGDLDLYAAMGGWYSADAFENALFENPGSGGRFLTVRLRGTRSNRSAIGARVQVRVRDAGGERDLYRTVGTGGSFGSSSLQLELGLGAAEEVLWMEVRWPSPGSVQRFTAVPLDAGIEVIEGEEAVRPFALESFSLVAPGRG